MNKYLFNEIKEIEGLPSCVSVDQKKEIIIRTINEYKIKNLLVEKVVNGLTTFEEAISPLIEENIELKYFNFRGDGCNSEKFDHLSKKIGGEFVNIFSLTKYVYSGRCGYHVNLLSTASFSRKIAWSSKFSGLLFLSIVITWLIMPLLPIFGATASASMGWKVAIWIGGGLGVFTFIVSMLGDIGDIQERKNLAKKILRQAKYLDEKIKEVK